MRISGTVCAYAGRVRIWVHGGCGLGIWWEHVGTACLHGGCGLSSWLACGGDRCARRRIGLRVLVGMCVRMGTGHTHGDLGVHRDAGCVCGGQRIWVGERSAANRSGHLWDIAASGCDAMCTSGSATASTGSTPRAQHPFVGRGATSAPAETLQKD